MIKKRNGNTMANNRMEQEDVRSRNNDVKILIKENTNHNGKDVIVTINGNHGNKN